MKITYDKIANAAYVYFKKSQKAHVVKTIPVTSDVMIDFGKKGDILGIEILNASSHIRINDLKGSKFQVLAA